MVYIESFNELILICLHANFPKPVKTQKIIVFMKVIF